MTTAELDVAMLDDVDIVEELAIEVADEPVLLRPELKLIVEVRFAP